MVWGRSPGCRHRWYPWYPSLDGYYRSRPEICAGSHPEPVHHLPGATTVGLDERERSAWLCRGKRHIVIADGRRRPGFLRYSADYGTAVSRAEETSYQKLALQAMGVREPVLIAQDTTDYGHDLGVKDGLAHLIENMTIA
jgi:ribosomal protein S12 methylthiotransferase